MNPPQACDSMLVWEREGHGGEEPAFPVSFPFLHLTVLGFTIKKERPISQPGDGKEVTVEGRRQGDMI